MQTEDDTRVSRDFRLADGAREPERAAAELEAQPGVLEARWQARSRRLHLVYDVRRIDARQVADFLRARGAPLATGLWTRWRLAAAAMQDENIRNNAGYRAACCSRPPPGAGHRPGGH